MKPWGVQAVFPTLTQFLGRGHRTSGARLGVWVVAADPLSAGSVKYLKL